MRTRSGLFAALLVATVALSGIGGGAQAHPAPVGQDSIDPGQPYAGDFPDPSVLRNGSVYIAYSTTSDGLNLPTLTSTDLRTWTALPATAQAPRGDALARTPAWSAGVEMPDGRFRAPVWAPSVARFGPGRFVLAYATQVASSPGQRMCISLATASSPIGPFIDTSTGPLICPARGGIDPQLLVSRSGSPWIYWKLDHYPAGLYGTQMNVAGTALLPGSTHLLARVQQKWEGRIIENPAMIGYHGRYYLFYSANSYATSRYAVGYMICKTLHGPCVRPRKTPLLATGGGLAGPGGATPFLDTSGRLRLAYHAWTAGATGYPRTSDCQATALGCAQRRLYVATLKVVKKGLLAVVARR